MLLPLTVALATLAACNKSDELSAEESVDQALYSIQERGGMGRLGCYELLFPVSITLPDGTTAEVDSYETMQQTLRNFFASSRPARPRINFVFPVSVVSQDGEVITVSSEEEMRALRAECAGSFNRHGPNGHSQRGLSCFEIVFPVTIEFPDGSTAQAGSRADLRQLVRSWHQSNPGSDGRPKLVFPLTVKMTDDGTLLTVNSKEELRDLKENCE